MADRVTSVMLRANRVSPANRDSPRPRSPEPRLRPQMRWQTHSEQAACRKPLPDKLPTWHKKGLSDESASPFQAALPAKQDVSSLT